MRSVVENEHFVIYEIWYNRVLQFKKHLTTTLVLAHLCSVAEAKKQHAGNVPSASRKATSAKSGTASKTTTRRSGNVSSLKVQTAGKRRHGKSIALGRGRQASRPVRQAAPSADRYREIQQALADKGYLKSTPNGVWDAESTDALKRFQTDQNLTADGKIGSLSLIALGLGPKRESISQVLATPEHTVPPSP